MDDTWSNRDLPVLKAVVDIYERTGRTMIRPAEIAEVVGFDKETVERALRAPSTEPYFGEPKSSWSGDILGIGPPNAKALRVAGQWPSPRRASSNASSPHLEVAGDDDEARQPEDRGKFKQAAAWLGTAASQVAIGALGGAGGLVKGNDTPLTTAIADTRSLGRRTPERRRGTLGV